MLGRSARLYLFIALFVGGLVSVNPVSAEIIKPSIQYGDSKDRLSQEIEKGFLKLDCNCLITVGSKALEKVLEKDDSRPVFSIGVSTASYARITSKYPDRKITVIYSDPDPQLLILLGEYFFGKYQLAMFHSSRTSFLERYESRVRLYDTKAGEIRKPLSSLDDVKALIIYPDSNIWNRDSFVAAVRSLYRQNKVAIGFSESLVKAGAFAALFSKKETIHQQLLSTVSQYSKNNIFPDPQYANDVDIAINEKIARSLNIPVDNKDDVLDSILMRNTQ